MKIDYNVMGERRKEMVQVIGNATEVTPVYMKVPTCAYKIGDITVSKTGELIWDEHTDAAMIRKVVKALSDAGFEGNSDEGLQQETEENTAKTPAQEDAPEVIGLTVEIPFDKVNIGNLMKLLDAKGDLIKKAIGVDDIRIEMKEDRVAFPWFAEVEPDAAMAYTNFIAALCRMSKEAKRVTATQKEVENEKYAFRCFLLRLGFIGAEYKKDRKILLKNLSGSAAFPSRKKADAFTAAQKVKVVRQRMCSYEHSPTGTTA